MRLLIPIEVRSMRFNFLLEEHILLASLRLENFTSTRLGPFLLIIQWRYSTLKGFSLTSSRSKIFKTVLSRVLLSLVSVIPINSRHSRLKNWLLLEYWHSKLVIISLKTELTCLATDRWVPSFSKFFSSNIFRSWYFSMWNQIYFSNLELRWQFCPWTIFLK